MCGPNWPSSLSESPLVSSGIALEILQEISLWCLTGRGRRGLIGRFCWASPTGTDLCHSQRSMNRIYWLTFRRQSYRRLESWYALVPASPPQSSQGLP